MNTLELLREGFANALTWPHLGWAFAGVTLGTAVGVLPGIGPALTVALLLPITFTLDPISAFIMFGGIYYGAMYGGSTTSILLNTPGETASIATAIDGYAMARQGRGAAALTTAAIGSFVAGTLATIALTFFSPLLASVALRFGTAKASSHNDEAGPAPPKHARNAVEAFRPTAREGGPTSLALIAFGLALQLALLERAGFVIASTLLFWLTARAFDDRHPFRDAAAAIAVSAASYLVFARMLDVSLPAGILSGWL